MTTLTKTDSRVTTIRDTLLKMKEQIQVALPKMVDTERFLRVCMTTIRVNPKLMDCTPMSLMGSIMRAAQLGLEPDNILGRAYLVPYGNECTLIIGYKGMVELARRSSQVSDIYAVVVYENEPFEIGLGTERFIKHVPLPPEQRGEKKVGAYSVAIMKDGTISFDFMWASEIEKIRDNHSMSYKSKNTKFPSPWQTHEDEMWKKTPVRRHSKWLPLTVEAQRAAAMDEAVEAGLAHEAYLGDDEVLDMASARAATKTTEKTAELKERIKQANDTQSQEESPPASEESPTEEGAGDASPFDGARPNTEAAETAVAKITEPQRKHIFVLLGELYPDAPDPRAKLTEFVAEYMRWQFDFSLSADKPNALQYYQADLVIANLQKAIDNKSSRGVNLTGPAGSHGGSPDPVRQETRQGQPTGGQPAAARSEPSAEEAEQPPPDPKEPTDEQWQKVDDYTKQYEIAEADWQRFAKEKAKKPDITLCDRHGLDKVLAAAKSFGMNRQRKGGKGKQEGLW